MYGQSSPRFQSTCTMGLKEKQQITNYTVCHFSGHVEFASNHFNVVQVEGQKIKFSKSLDTITVTSLGYSRGKNIEYPSLEIIKQCMSKSCFTTCRDFAMDQSVGHLPIE